MKLYIIPLQATCNAKCVFCITKYKKETCFGDKLDLKDMRKVKDLETDKIEITGGGEPLLHPDIEKIIEISARKAPTQMYTNGALMRRLKKKTARKLSRLCLSRSHHLDWVNEKIMGIKYDLKTIKEVSNEVPVKLSVVACRSGIATAKDLEEYVRWGKKELGVGEVVVRQMFEFSYPPEVAREEIKVEKLFSTFKGKCPMTGLVNENPVLMIKGVKVEFEQEVCACQVDNLVLRPNGVIYQGWEKEVYES